MLQSHGTLLPLITSAHIKKISNTLSQQIFSCLHNRYFPMISCSSRRCPLARPAFSPNLVCYVHWYLRITLVDIIYVCCSVHAKMTLDTNVSLNLLTHLMYFLTLCFSCSFICCLCIVTRSIIGLLDARSANQDVSIQCYFNQTRKTIFIFQYSYLLRTTLKPSGHRLFQFHGSSQKETFRDRKVT